MKKEESNNY